MLHMNCVQIAGFEWCHGNLKGKFSKKYSKIFSSEAMMGMKLKLSIHVHDISLYISCVFIVLLYNGKSGNWHLFLCYCRYFDKRFTDMFLE